MSPPEPARTQRLFLALWPGEAVRQRIEEHTRGWSWPAECVRYASADWHITLLFIGAVPVERVADVATALAMPSAPFVPFDLLLDQPQHWNRGLAVLVASQVPPALQQLHDRLASTLQALDLPVDNRPYRPHLTLARQAALAVPPASGPAVRWPVSGYALVESTGLPHERYRVLRPYGAWAARAP